jgi:hypothetical protein
MYDNIEPLIDRRIDDEKFRMALQRNPEAAVVTRSRPTATLSPKVSVRAASPRISKVPLYYSTW